MIVRRGNIGSDGTFHILNSVQWCMEIASAAAAAVVPLWKALKNLWLLHHQLKTTSP